MTDRGYPSSKYFLGELLFATSRSSGPGGQNVNKVNSKVTLKWDVINSSYLNDEQKEIISKKLHSRITKDGVLTISGQETRSQIQNKEDVIKKLDELLVTAFTPREPRKATKPSKSAKLKRLDSKKQTSEKKQWRQKL